MGGGLLAVGLGALGVPERLGYPVGFLLACIASPCLYVVSRRRENLERTAWEGQRTSLEALAIVTTVAMTLRRAWRASSELDWPVYLFEDEDAVYLLATGEDFTLPGDGQCRKLLEVTLVPRSDDIVTIEWSGATVRFATNTLPEPVEDWPGDGKVTILHRETLPHEWLGTIDAV
jgi:hypothetical protein